MIAKKLITKTQLAKLAGVSLPAVSQKLKTDLADAIVGKKLDADHPAVEKFLNSTRKRQASEDKYEKQQKNRLDEQKQKELKVEKYLDLTLREIIKLFGSDSEFVDFLRASKLIEEIQEKRIKNEISLSKLISRDFVKDKVLNLIDNSNRRLLVDTPRSIVTRVINAKETGESKEIIEQIVTALISAQLKSVKQQAQRNLRK